jgi:SSS family transporter
MLSPYDYIMIAFYFGFMLSLGFIFKKFNSDSEDYFAGGFKMTWWLLGSSVFVGNFSAWTFTGAAYVAHSFGVVVMVIFWGNAFNYVIQALWLAPWFRQIRVVTAMDAIKERFGTELEQCYTWMQILLSFVGNAVTLLSVSLVISTIFQVPITPTIIITGTVVVTMSLLGGSWAVAASDFIQSILILSVALIASGLCILHIGGIEEFWAQVPESRKSFLLEGDVKYDKWWVLAMVIGGIYMNNNLGMTAKYIAAKDSKAASRAAWLAFFGFTFITPIFFIPAMSTFSIVPELEQQYSHHKKPSELSYIATCIAVLPNGMLGLLAAGLFSATMSSMDTYLNKVSGFFTQNFYKTIIKKNNVSNEHLLKVGQFVTLFLGAFSIINAVILSQSKIALFDVFQMTNSYLIIPMGIPVCLGLFVKRTPKWASFAVIFIGAIVAMIIYNDLKAEWIESLKISLFGHDLNHYISNHAFAVVNLINTPLLTIIFIGASVFFPLKDEKAIASEDHFFEKMHQPIDFEKEVGGDNSHTQAKILGRLMMTYSGFTVFGVLIPNETSGRVSFLICALIMGIIGLVLELAYRKSLAKMATVS